MNGQVMVVILVAFLILTLVAALLHHILKPFPRGALNPYLT